MAWEVSSVKVAAAKTAPILFDLEASVEKACRRTADARQAATTRLRVTGDLEARETPPILKTSALPCGPSGKRRKARSARRVRFDP